jgi:LPS sulfotransferase NodH
MLAMTAAAPARILSFMRQQSRPPRRRLLRVRQFHHQAKLMAQWWLKSATTYQPVFVLATHRSGSNLLVDYLNRLPGVKCLSEILCYTLPYGLARSQHRRQTALGHIRRSLHPLSTSIRGCKLMLDQLSNCRLPLDVLDAALPRAKYIVLYRQSLAEQFLSRQAAKATQQWFLVDGQEPKQARVAVDGESIRSYCTSIRESYREILDHAWLPQRGVLLSYEELTADPYRCFAEQICPLLGVPPSRPETALRKQNTLPLAERVANYREVAPLLTSPLCRQHYSWSQSTALRRAA